MDESEEAHKSKREPTHRGGIDRLAPREPCWEIERYTVATKDVPLQGIIFCGLWGAWSKSVLRLLKKPLFLTLRLVRALFRVPRTNCKPLFSCTFCCVTKRRARIPSVGFAVSLRLHQRFTRLFDNKLLLVASQHFRAFVGST